MEKIIAKKSVFAMKKVLIHKNLKVATLRLITTQLGSICTLSHENPSCGLRERLQQTVFHENPISEDKTSLRTSALAHFIQNKLYLQYIFIILL